MRIMTTRYLFGLVALVLAGCSQVYLTQNEDEAIVRIGPYSSKDHGTLPVADIAGYYIPYLLLSVRAYGGEQDPGDGWRKLYGMTDERGVPLKERIDSWMKSWRWVHKGFAEDYLPCSYERIDQGRCRSPVGGLGIHTFVRDDCSEVVVAFRGTNFDQVDDWFSNLRWFNRLLPLYDQYEQVQDFAPEIVEVMREECPKRKSLQLTAVGHSLGGGLAQQMAYASAEVTRVYGFDPSMVTGYYDVDSAARDKLTSLEIDRVYEHGEVLAYFRYFLRQFAPPAACNPQIRNIRFDVLKGNLINQHSSPALAAKMIAITGSQEQWQQRQKKYHLPTGSEVSPANCPATSANSGPRRATPPPLQRP